MSSSSSIKMVFTLHGLKDTTIYKVIEFTAVKCFESFINEFFAFRRMGDIDKDKAILGQMSKLLGNSSYILIRRKTYKNLICIRIM